MKHVYAEDVNYWRTGQSSPDKWTDDVQRQHESSAAVLAWLEQQEAQP